MAKTFSLSLPEIDAQKIEAAAKEKGMSIQSFIKEKLKQSDHNQPEDEQPPIRVSHQVALAQAITQSVEAKIQSPLATITEALDGLNVQVGQVVLQLQAVRSKTMTNYQSELDRWYVIKAEMVAVRALVSDLALVLSPFDEQTAMLERIQFINQRMEELEQHIPPVPDYFLPKTTQDIN